jgi:hypothetical protein
LYLFFIYIFILSSDAEKSPPYKILLMKTGQQIRTGGTANSLIPEGFTG